MPAGGDSKPAVRVWDLLVRIGHWSLVIGIVAAWFTRGKWHEWLGYAVLGIVVLRIVWGLIARGGSRYARFTQFLRSPAGTLQYTKQILSYCEPRYLGHNPLGGWMIVALLITIIGVCATGWLYTTERFWGIEWVEELHEGLTNFLIALVGLHIGGVIFSSWRHGENLVAAMINGRKRTGDGDVN
ncbi:MAG: cytochrome b/b6 domain-containing protein [Burkholderiales bacterium]